MKDKIIKGKFVKTPMPYKEDIEETTQEEFDKMFSNMLGHIYYIYLSDLGKYVIFGGTNEESEKEFQESIYKSLVSMGEDEEYARKVAKGEEEADGCMYFPEYCFKILEGEKK